MSHTLLLAVSIALVAAGGWICALNWSTVLVYILQKRKAGSWIPLVGGVLVAIGLALNPQTTSWWWVPLLLDWGCVPGFLQTAYCWIKG